MSAAVGFEQLFEELRSRGLLLEADPVLPSVARIVIGGPYKGSWWAHPLSNRIYMLSQQLEHRPDVLFVRFLSAKMTHIHHRMWPDFYAVATARERWQFEALPQSAKALLAEVGRSGRLRTDQMPSLGSAGKLGADARLLEAKLLVHGEEVHTQSGAHAKAVESWPHWAARVGFAPVAASAESARARFDQIVQALNSQHAARALTPWNRPGRQTSKPAPRA